jgi:hypothetical protein
MSENKKSEKGKILVLPRYIHAHTYTYKTKLRIPAHTYIHAHTGRYMHICSLKLSPCIIICLHDECMCIYVLVCARICMYMYVSRSMHLYDQYMCMYVFVFVCACMYLYLINVICPAQKAMVFRADLSVMSNQLSKTHSSHSKTPLTVLGLECPIQMHRRCHVPQYCH